MKINSISTEFPRPDNTIKFTAGPSQQHKLVSDLQQLVDQADQMSHRSQFAKDLISRANDCVFDAFGITEEQRNREFDFESPDENPEGWHVCWTNSGTDGMERAIRAGCPKDGTLLVNTDNFSKVAGQEMKASGRNFEEISFERGDALLEGCEEFEDISDRIKNGSIQTVYLTENGTTTGANQRGAIEALIRIRNASGSSTLIVVDAVSGQIFGVNREAIPDIIIWANQKDTAIGTGSGNLLFNNKALTRALEVSACGLDTGGKLGLESAYGNNKKRFTAIGQTAQTPPMGLIYKQLLVYQRILDNDGQECRNIASVQEEAKKLIGDALCKEDDFELLTSNPSLQSQTSHVLRVPMGRDVPGIIRGLHESGFSISSGYGEFKDSEIRICVYSANTLAQIEDLIKKMKTFF
ncbi:MAG: hypothetical protein ABIA92_03275 [Patescibacteria group bacterium]